MFLKILANFSSLSLLVFYVLLISPTVVLAVTNQQVTFYSQPNKEGVPSVYTDIQNPVPPGISNSQSFCVDLGLWKATLDISNPSAPTSVAHYGGSLGSEVCRNRPTDGSHWSFRSWEYVGPRDLEASSLSLFDRGSYAGNLHAINASEVPSFPGGIKSISSYFITGPQNWAVFPDVDFNGTATCWTSVSSTSATFGAKGVQLLDPPVLVGSLRRGCDGDDNPTSRRPPPAETGAAVTLFLSTWHFAWIFACYVIKSWIVC